jgi:hypothetical protein
VLLLLTTAGDGTSDRLAQRLGNHIFRLNFDQLPEYKIFFGLNNWYVENPVGRSISSEVATRVLWWKAFGATPDGYDKYLIEESKYLSSASLCNLESLTSGFSNILNLRFHILLTFV